LISLIVAPTLYE